jgi:hypothetical protein
MFFTTTFMLDKSEPEVELLRAAYAAFNARDPDATLATMTSDVAASQQMIVSVNADLQPVEESSLASTNYRYLCNEDRPLCGRSSAEHYSVIKEINPFDWRHLSYS